MPLLKILFTLVVLAGVAWFFASILTNEELQKTDRSRSPAQILWDQARAARPGDLVLAIALYLSGMAFSGLFWVGLVRTAGGPLPSAPAFAPTTSATSANTRPAWDCRPSCA